MPSNRDNQEVIAALQRKANDPSIPPDERTALLDKIKLLRNKYKLPQPVLETPSFDDIRIYGNYQKPEPVIFIYVPASWFFPRDYRDWDLDLEEDPTQNEYEWGE